ncbi:MAG TPA: HWE histidine kinase domain-containing protein [Caulobacteraceae bacterium]|jgi:two-component sensor histidine kinase
MSEALRFEAIARPVLEAWLDLDQVVLDAIPVGIYVCDAEGRIVRVNRQAIELWGRTVRPLDPAQRFCGSFRVESLDGQLIPPEQTPMSRAVLLGERFENAVARVQNPDGKRWIAEVNVEPLTDDSGALVGAINCFRDITTEHELRAAVARQQHTFDLAMIAADMGTWRYTIADNICLYDDNAQRLYGLTEGPFLHDEAGVAAKFHPDDMERMWANVAKALDPAGDGRYEVEYRVKQLDGGWRWLSAWGLVEFEGEGPDRKPVAIAGASRDLTERKRAEETQRLLANELNHRVKNTLATVQSISSQTLRAATDLDHAREALEERIVSLARAHDLLTDRSWSGADLCEVAPRALQPFPAGQLDLAGPSLDVSPQHALALSLALHELATNAAKYGALSAPDGRVEVRWSGDDGAVRLTWQERGGPAVSPPTRRGFGSRLLEACLRDIGGHSQLLFEPQGVRAAFEAPL